MKNVFSPPAAQVVLWMEVTSPDILHPRLSENMEQVLLAFLEATWNAADSGYQAGYLGFEVGVEWLGKSAGGIVRAQYENRSSSIFEKMSGDSLNAHLRISYVWG